jgi:hypothetical protein
MASAGLLKIISTGLQDDRLCSQQPSAEFFKKTFIRAGRFTTEWHRVDFDNSPAFGTTATATLPRRGHLITRAYLVTRMPDISSTQAAARAYCASNGVPFAGPTIGWTNSIGHALITQAQVLIGGAPIDTLDGRLMEVLDEFHTPLEKTTVVNRLIGRADSGFTPKTNGFSTTGQEVVTPLPFWFNRGDPACALPIDAIGADSVQLQVTFAPVASLTVSTSRIINAQGQQAYPPVTAPFFYINPAGSPVKGLNGNPSTSVLASQIPGIQMPLLQIQDASLLLEYVYLDKPEANRIRLGDLTYPIVQHYAIQPVQSKFQAAVRVAMRIPNPIRDMYFMAHRTDADALNAPFLATRDLSGLFVADISGTGPIAPWWPDAQGLNTSTWIPLTPAYSGTDSEPIASFSLTYEGKLTRYATDCPALFRVGLPEQTKTPWHNKYYYHIPFGTRHEITGVSRPMGHANLDKIQSVELSVEFKAARGSARRTAVPDYTMYVWAETYTILRVYGGRAGLLFGY